jgi:hypothetical protein
MLYPETDPIVGCGIENVRDSSAPGAWLDSIYSNVQDVILDVPGGAMNDLFRVVHGGAASLCKLAKKANREVVVVSVIGTKIDATHAPMDSLEAFDGTAARHIVLKNGYFGKPEDFVIFEGVDGRYGRAGAAVRAAGAEVLYLPKLDVVTDARLDVELLTFAAAASAGAKIGRRAAFNAEYWLDAVKAAFAGSWLDVTGAVPTIPTVSSSKNGKAAAVSAETANA